MGYLSIERKQVQQSAVPHFFKKKKKKLPLSLETIKPILAWMAIFFCSQCRALYW